MFRFRGLPILLMLFLVVFNGDADQDARLFAHPILVTLKGHLQKPLPNQVTDDITVSITFEDPNGDALKVSCGADSNLMIYAPSDARSTTTVDSGTSHFVFGATSEYRVQMDRSLSGNISADPLFGEHYGLIGFFLDVHQGHVEPQRRETYDNTDRVFIRLEAVQEPDKQPYTFCDWREPFSTKLLKGQGIVQLHFNDPSSSSGELPFEVDDVVVSGYKLTAHEIDLTKIRDNGQNKLPDILNFCEATSGKRHCSSLHWMWGAHGYMSTLQTYPPITDVLVVKRFDSEAVVLQLQELDGSPISTYTGTLGRGQINGTSVKPSKGNTIDSLWTATFVDLQTVATKSELPKIDFRSSGNIVDLPHTMHLCTDQCQTLTWTGDHFDGKSDSDGKTVSSYTVDQWNATGVSFTGKALKLPITAVFKGAIAPQGGSIENPILAVQIKSKTIINGASYQLTWTPAHVASTPVGQTPISRLQTSLIGEPGGSNLSENTATNNEGDNVAPAQAALIASAKVYQAQMLASAQAAIQGSINGKAQKPAAPIRLTAEEAATHLRQKVSPIYPKKITTLPLPTEISAGYTVAIGVDGHINNLRITGIPSSALVDSATAAVEAWIYDPFIQNGHPVECVTSIDFHYTFHCANPSDSATCK